MTSNPLSTLRVFAGLTPQTGDLPLDQVADAARWAVAEIERLRAERDEAVLRMCTASAAQGAAEARATDAEAEIERLRAAH